MGRSDANQSDEGRRVDKAGWLSRAFEQHKAARRIALFWAMGLITYATHALFSDVSAITGPSVTAYATVVGLMTVVVGFYQYMRRQDQ